MIPLLLITDSKQNADKYIKSFSKDKNTYTIQLTPEKSEYTIAQIKQLSKEGRIYHPEIRIYVLSNFDKSSLEAQNAFLKLLEEPPANTLFVLTAASPYSLLPTVVSRTQIIKLDNNKSTADDFIIDLIKLTLLPIASQGEALEAVDKLTAFFKNRLMTDNRSPSILKEIIKTGDLLKKNNLNSQLAVDHLLIFIHKMYIKKL